MIDKLLKIGKELEGLNLDSKSFNLKCLEVLENLSVDCDLESFSAKLSDWLLCNTIPRQLNIYNSFGQPPVTIFNNESFVIDIYFWMEADTSIHSHAFNGAFKVLFGKSLHESFSIEKEFEYSPDVVMNKLILKESEVLQAGDCKLIKKGNEFNHRVVHLSSPTVSLCIRTITDLDTPQWHYFDNGLSILKRELSPDIIKKMLYGNYLWSIDQNLCHKYFNNFINNLESSTLINLFETLTIDTMGLNEDSQEIIYQLMMNKFNNTKWYEIYEQSGNGQVDSHPYLSEEQKLLSHLKIQNYPQKEIDRLCSTLLRYTS